MVDDIELAGRLIDDLRERDDVVHVERYDFDNKQIEIIVDPKEMELPDEVFFPGDILRQAADAGFIALHAGYSSDGKYPPDARVIGFERL